MSTESPTRSTSPVRPAFWWTLIVVVSTLVVTITAIQFLGAPPGEPCVDSYSCQGFLIGGAECVDDEGAHYCTRYCDSDIECPAEWRCGDAHPTALTIELRVIDQVCLRAN